MITGSIRARPETLEAIKAASLTHVARSRTEDGCEHHAVHVDAEDPLRLVFVERWRDKAAVRKHFADPHSRAFVEAVGKLAAGATTLEIYEATSIARRDLSQ